MAKNRFFNNDDDDLNPKFSKEEDHEDDDDNDEQYFDMDDLDDAALFLDTAQMELVNREQNQKALKLATKMAEKTLFWKFRKLNTKLRIISEYYFYFVNLLDSD
jgi:hypothetical protein